MIDVVVFGKDRYNTLGVIRSLGRYGIPVFLLLKKTATPSYCRLSKYVAKIKRVDTVDEGIRFLLNDYNSEDKSKTVIIPTSDSIVSRLDFYYDDLSNKFIFPNAGKKGSLVDIMDKAKMTEIASKSGLSTPITIAYSCGDELPENIPFPCLTKPAKSIEGSKAEIKVCNTVAELDAATSQQKKGHKLLLQQYIRKEYDVLLLGSRCPNGKIFLSGVFKKERWISMGNDGSFGLITTDYAQWFKKTTVERFLENLNYVGPFSIECGVEKEVPYFYEINLRNDGTSHYFDKTGFCNVYAWVMECLNNTVEYSGEGSYFFVDEFGDFLNVITHQCTFKQWRHDKKKAIVYKYKNADDNKPMFVIFPYMLAQTIKNIVKIVFGK